MSKQPVYVSFCYRHGVWDALPEFTELESDSPQYYWLDLRPVLPEPEAKKPAIFGRGYPELNGGWTLDELYLFWETRGLHVVAWEGGGYRWFEFLEGERPDEGGWESLESVAKVSSPVLLRAGRNWENSGKMCRVEYWSDNQVIGWRLDNENATPATASSKPSKGEKECSS